MYWWRFCFCFPTENPDENDPNRRVKMVRKFECQYCGKLCFSRSKLKSHLSKSHTCEYNPATGADPRLPLEGYQQGEGRQPTNKGTSKATPSPNLPMLHVHFDTFMLVYVVSSLRHILGWRGRLTNSGSNTKLILWRYVAMSQHVSIFNDVIITVCSHCIDQFLIKSRIKMGNIVVISLRALGIYQ